MSLFKPKPHEQRDRLDQKEQVVHHMMAQIDRDYNDGKMTALEHRNFRDDLFARLCDIKNARNQTAMSTPMNTAQQQMQIAQQQMSYQQQQQHAQAVANNLLGLANQQAALLPQNMFRQNPLPPPPREKPLESADQFGEVTGWRCWRIPVRPLLCSVHMHKHVWMPGAVEECDAGPDLDDHSAHGFHAWKDQRQAVNYAVECGPPIVIGTVKLWGTVLCHERGYRAQFAKIVSLDTLTARYDDPVIEERALRLMRKHYGV